MNYFEELQAKLEVVDEEKVAEIIEFSKKSIPLEFIPKTKYNEKVEELTTTNAKLEETNKKIEELSKTETDAKEYKEKLETLNQEYEKFKDEAEERVSEMKKNSILKDRLIQEGADKDNIDLLMKDFDVKEMSLNDDGIIGLDEYLKPIKEKRARLFVQEEIGTNTPKDGTDAEATSVDDNKLREAMGLDPK